RLRRDAREAQVGEVALDRVAQGLRVGAHLEQGVLARDGLLLRGAGHALELGGGLGGHAGRVLDQPGGGVRREVPGAQLLGRALQARDEGIEGGGVDLAHRYAPFSPISRRAAARMPLTKPGASAPQNCLAVSTASEMAPSGGIGASPGAASGWTISSRAMRMIARSSGAIRSSVQPRAWRSM